VNIVDRRTWPNVERVCHEVSGLETTLEIGAKADEWLTNEWYTSFDERYYRDKIYVPEGYHCWAMFTRQTLKAANKVIEWYLDEVAAPGRKLPTIIDIGAGIGASTVQLAQRWPKARVIYTNLPGYQIDVAVKLFKLYDVADRIEVDDSGKPRTGEIVIACELLEHIYDPIDFIAPYLTDCRLFIDGSSFTIKGYGHYPEYANNVQPKNMRRTLNRFLREVGFTPVNQVGGPKLWNSRPSCWVRN
jgi:hypothetical protein